MVYCFSYTSSLPFNQFLFSQIFTLPFLFSVLQMQYAYHKNLFIIRNRNLLNKSIITCAIVCILSSISGIFKILRSKDDIIPAITTVIIPTIQFPHCFPIIVYSFKTISLPLKIFSNSASFFITVTKNAI